MNDFHLLRPWVQWAIRHRLRWPLVASVLILTPVVTLAQHLYAFAMDLVPEVRDQVRTLWRARP